MARESRRHVADESTRSRATQISVPVSRRHPRDRNLGEISGRISVDLRLLETFLRLLLDRLQLARRESLALLALRRGALALELALGLPLVAQTLDLRGRAEGRSGQLVVIAVVMAAVAAAAVVLRRRWSRHLRDVRAIGAGEGLRLQIARGALVP